MKTIALTWGWTGWHIYPLLSIYNYINDEEIAMVWVGWKKSLEEKIAKENEITFLPIKSGKLRRYFDLKNFYEPFLNIVWFFQGIFYIFHYNIDVVFSKWGFVSIPLCLAAKLMWKEIYIHESDTVSGLSNKIVWKLATKIFYSFNNDNIDGKKHILTGQIVNPKMFSPYKEIKEINENWNTEVLVIAWSQGSTIIFENLIKIIQDLPEMNFKIVLGTQNTHFKEKFEKFTNVKTFDYTTQEELSLLYKRADIAVTRGWATSLWELYFFWVHSIIVPLSTSAWNHQFHNAEYFKKEVWSDVLDENKNLHLELFRKLNKYKTLKKKGLNLWWYNYANETIKKMLKK